LERTDTTGLLPAGSDPERNLKIIDIGNLGPFRRIMAEKI
jgi:hypothetical protein